MASIVLTDATCWIGAYDFTTDLNQITLGATVDELDCTTFGSGGYRSRVGGLRDVQAQVAGYWQSAASAAPDPQAFPDLGTADRVCTFAPTPTEGSVAYTALLGKFGYQLFGQHGEATPFSLTMNGTNKVGLVRGRVASARRTVSTTGAFGSGVDLGNAAAGQVVYAALHVFTAGTTITVVVERDDASDFSSPVTVATMGPITTTGGVWSATSSIASSNNYYRLRVSAITGSFQVAGVIAIGS